VFTFTGDGEGIFAFAVIPGVLYNTLRERALEGDPAFRAVILRDPPTEDVTNEDGSLDYEALVKRGFTYPTPATTTPPPNAFVPADFWRGSGEFAEDIGDEFRRVNERVAATFGKEGDFLIDLDILNTDVGFFNDDYDPPMLSGWRRGPGGSPKAIHPYGAKLRLQTDMLLRDTTINSRGRARLRAFKGARYNVCIEARNDAGVISEFLTPIIACHIGEHGEDDDWGEVPQVEAAAFYQKIVIRDYIINLLTQFTDSRD
jgi:hypothetical protein